MTTFIAHRGNLNGPNPKDENHPDYIMEAFRKTYMVEIDLRMFGGKLWLGHDEPQYEIESKFLFDNKPKLWIHCKDRLALEYCQLNRELNYFWHDTDAYTLTSWNYIWAYPGEVPIGNRCVMVMPELHWETEDILRFSPYGFCSDYVEQLKTYK